MLRLARGYLLVASVFSLCLATVTSAATTDFTADGDVTVPSVVYGSVTADLLILNGSKAESWNFDSGNFIVTNSDTTNPFRVGSSNSDVKSIRVKVQAGSEVACTNNTTPGTSYVEVPAVGAYAAYPSAELCDATSGTTGSGGGGGGGGGKKKDKTPPTLPQVPASPTPVAPALVQAAPQAAFFRHLEEGNTGEDVKRLQRFLNTNGYVVANVGPGSTGQETETFGPATKAALIKFQLAKGIIPSANALGAGRLGPATSATVNSLQGGVLPGVSVAASPMSEADKQVLLQSLRTQLAALMAQLQGMLQEAAGQAQ